MIEQEGMVLRYATNSLKMDKRLATKAIMRNKHALTLLPKELKRDRELIMTALTHDGDIFDIIEVRR